MCIAGGRFLRYTKAKVHVGWRQWVLEVERRDAKLLSMSGWRTKEKTWDQSVATHRGALYRPNSEGLEHAGLHAWARPSQFAHNAVWGEVRISGRVAVFAETKWSRRTGEMVFASRKPYGYMARRMTIVRLYVSRQGLERYLYHVYPNSADAVEKRRDQTRVIAALKARYKVPVTVVK